MAEQTTRDKLVVIGLDGLTFDIVHHLIGQGRLPALAGMMREGTWSDLSSTVMPNSYPAWTSCITGVNPGKHGIFWAIIRDDVGGGSYRLMNSFDINARTLWEIAGDHGLKVGVVNVPPIYPPYEVQGFMVSGALVPDETVEFTYPDHLKHEIWSVVPDYRCEIDFAQVNRHRIAAELLASVERREQLMCHFIKKKEWDLLFCVFTESDLAQHKFWPTIDPLHPDHRVFVEDHGPFVHTLYERLDLAVSRILESLPEKTTVLIVSDHGFGPYYQSFSMKDWLIDNGYLVLKPGKATVKKAAKSLLGMTGLLRVARSFKQSADYYRMKVRGKSGVRQMRDLELKEGSHFFEHIDWTHTRVYATPDYGLRLNLADRESMGIVRPGDEQNALTKELVDRLSALKYSNGEPVFETVCAREDIYVGPRAAGSPDIVVPINHAGAPVKPEAWPYTSIHPSLKGTHTPTGIFMARGDMIRKGFHGPAASILDITPTVLYHFGIPLTEEMDGAVLVDIFEDAAHLDRRIQRHGSSYEIDRRVEGASAHGDDAIKNRFRELGYIE